MKKQYIQPESHIVVVKLMGSVLQTTVGMGGASDGARTLNARQSDNSFSWDDEEEEIEESLWK